MVIRRVEGWPLILSRFLRSRAKMPFCWGKNDCIMFCADAVMQITGIDFASNNRNYKTKSEAEDLLRHYGGLENIIGSCLGSGHYNYLAAKRGDVVLMMLDTGPTAGIVDDSGARIVSVGANGLIKLPLIRAYKIWSY